MPSPILRTRWKNGPPAPRPTGPVLVSLTEFTALHHSQAGPIALAGLRLRRGWPRTPGAVGMWLWADPVRKRSGSVSFWEDEAALRAFVGRPDHLRIVRAHQGRGSMRATSWHADRFDADSAWATALTMLADPAPFKEAGAS
ncbi:hypothetical protein [Streptomyces sp. NPDC003006]